MSGSERGAVIASGALDRALSRQLASVQPVSADVRIGVSFRAGSGEVCRTFEASETAGIACRDDDDRRLRRAIAIPRTVADGYRQAGSADIMQAAQAMMTGVPFDARQERAAREADWK